MNDRKISGIAPPPLVQQSKPLALATRVPRLERELRDRMSEVFDFFEDHAFDGVWFWDIETGEEWYSESFCNLLGYSTKDSPGTADWWQELIDPEHKEVALENATKHLRNPEYPYDQLVRYQHKNGNSVWVRCRGCALRDKNGTPTRMIGVHIDVTEMMETVEELNHTKARLEKENKHDHLTGLLNRRGIESAMQRCLAQVERLECEAYAVFLDLDDFKEVNESYGHDGGDTVLQETAKAMQSAVRVTDECGRVAGDEFMVFILSRNREEAETIAERIRHTVSSNEVDVNGRKATVTASSAILPLYLPGSICIDRLDVLLRTADPYLKRGKKSGKNKVVPASIMPPSNA